MRHVPNPWRRVATLPLDGGKNEAIVTIVPRARPPGASVEVIVNSPMTPMEARMLAAAIVAASREAEEP